MTKKRKCSPKEEQELAGRLMAAMPQGPQDGDSILGLMQMGAQILLKGAIEQEITQHLGRSYYQHRAGGDGEVIAGERNGYRPTRVDTPSGVVVYDRPLLAYAPDFKSQFHVPHLRRPQAFSNALADMHVNGVSTRNVRRALKSVASEKARLSKSVVSRVTKRIRTDFKLWKGRDLSKLPVVYLFLDAIRLGMRMESTRKDAVLIAYAVLEDGSFETLSIGVKHSESEKAWEDFIVDMKLRGLKDPLLVVSDGNPGVIKTIERHFPTAWRQRCVKHRVDNILETVPDTVEIQKEVRGDLDRIFYGSTSLEQAKQAVEDFRKKYRSRYPAAVGCLERDLPQCLTFYLFPASHWKRIRTSNRLERMNLEIKRRLNSIGRHPSEEGCLALVYQLCKRHAEGRRGFKANDLVEALWVRLREKKLEMIEQLELGLELKAA